MKKPFSDQKKLLHRIRPHLLHVVFLCSSLMSFGVLMYIYITSVRDEKMGENYASLVLIIARPLTLVINMFLLVFYIACLLSSESRSYAGWATLVVLLGLLSVIYFLPA